MTEPTPAVSRGLSEEARQTLYLVASIAGLAVPVLVAAIHLDPQLATALRDFAAGLGALAGGGAGVAHFMLRQQRRNVGDQAVAAIRALKAQRSAANQGLDLARAEASADCEPTATEL